jgi:hypothetical protein
MIRKQVLGSFGVLMSVFLLTSCVEDIGIYNLLNRHNVYSIMYDPDSRSWKSLSLFPIMPTVSWSMKF